MWWLYLIAFAVGAFLGMCFILAKLPAVGTLYVDMESNDDKDIARIVFDKPFDYILRYGLMTIKIERKSNLSSFDGKL